LTIVNEDKAQKPPPSQDKSVQNLASAKKEEEAEKEKERQKDALAKATEQSGQQVQKKLDEAAQKVAVATQKLVEVAKVAAASDAAQKKDNAKTSPPDKVYDGKEAAPPKDAPKKTTEEKPKEKELSVKFALQRGGEAVKDLLYYVVAVDSGGAELAKREGAVRNGDIEEVFPEKTAAVRLYLGGKTAETATHAVVIKLGALKAAGDAEGKRQRLRNLGYFRGAVEEAKEDAARAAQAFDAAVALGVYTREG
jgi:colicin import membrane protein